MAISRTPLDIYRNATTTINGVAKLNGAPTNITGSTITFRAKYNYEDVDGEAVIMVSSPTGGVVLTDPVNGAFRITIAASATSILPAQEELNLIYVIKLVEASGDIRMLASGPLRIFGTA